MELSERSWGAALIAAMSQWSSLRSSPQALGLWRRFGLWHVGVYFGVAFISTALAAQTSSRTAPSGTDFQSWNELDVVTRLTRSLDATWIAEGRFSSELPNPTVYAAGTELNFSLAKHLVLAPTYYYHASLTASGASQHRSIAMVALTPKLEWKRLTISDRNRFIGDLRTGDQFFAYTNRPRIDYRAGPPRWNTSLFAWGEAFYRSDHGGWSRSRFAAGCRKALNDRFAANLFYQRQNDDASTPAHINAIYALLE